LRRELRVAIVSILLGTVIGVGLVAFGRDHNTDITFTMTHVGTSGDEPTSAPVADPMAVGPDSGAIKTDLASVDADTTDGKRTDQRKTETSNTDVSKANVSKTDTSKTGKPKADASTTACGDSIWAYLDGSCIPGKPRRVKVRAATDRPAIAAAPLGRSTAAPLDDVAAPPPAAATAPEGVPAQASEGSPAAAPSATPPAATSQPAARSQPAVTAHKKPQRAAHSHHRNDNERSARDDSRGRRYVVYVRPRRLRRTRHARNAMGLGVVMQHG
jgi:hypothetical protein